MNDQLRALLMQRMCNGIAKAFCAACDEGNFSCQLVCSSDRTHVFSDSNGMTNR